MFGDKGWSLAEFQSRGRDLLIGNFELSCISPFHTGFSPVVGIY